MELVLMICLMTAPSDCRDEHLTLSMEAMTPQQCMLGAQPAMAEWSAAHPKYSIVRWKCGQPRLEGTRI